MTKAKNPGGRPQELLRNLPLIDVATKLPDKPVSLAREKIRELDAETLALHLERILMRHSEGENLLHVLREYDFDLWRLRNLLDVNDHWYPRYNRARDAYADTLLHDIINISDDKSQDSKEDRFGNKLQDKEWVARSKIRIDARALFVERTKNRRLIKYSGTSIKDRADFVANALLKNEITEEQAEKVLNVLSLHAKIIEVHDLEARIAALEKLSAK